MVMRSATYGRTETRLVLWLTVMALMGCLHNVVADTATLSTEAVAAGFTLRMTATGFPESNPEAQLEQLAGVVTFADPAHNNAPKIMVDGIPSGNIYVFDDVDGQTPPSGQTHFTPVSNAGTSGAQAMVIIGSTVYLADALHFRILQIALDGTVAATPLVDFLPIRPTALAVNARNSHLIVSGGGQVLDIDPKFESFTQYTVLISDWGTGGIAFSEDYTTLFVEGGVWGRPEIRRYKIDGLTATRDASYAGVKASEQMYGLVVGTGCLSPSLFMSAASGFYEIKGTGSTPTLVPIINSIGAGFLARDEKDGCLLFTSTQLYRLCPPVCGGFVGITPAPVDPCATNNGGCPVHSDCTATITSAPSCTCAVGYISSQPTSNQCVEVQLTGAWSSSSAANAGLSVRIVQTGTQLSATALGSAGNAGNAGNAARGALSTTWSATGAVMAAGAVQLEYSSGAVPGTIFNAQQKQIEWDDGTTWTKQATVGGACQTHADCSSGNCVASVCKAADVGKSCSGNEDCTSQNCGTEEPRVCLANGVGGKCVLASDCLSNILCQLGKCQGVNSCYTLNGGCHADAVCTPAGSGRRKCKCNTGYDGNGVGAKGCRGPCSGNPAAKHGGSISCAASATDGPYVKDGASCELVCPAGFYARGSYKCDDGHWKDKDYPLCSAASCSHPDVSHVAHATPGTCVGKKTYHDCILGCEEGYLPSGNTRAVCLGTSGPHAAYSVNTFTCKDVDECSYLPRRCGDGWQCTNAVGSYTCVPLAPRLAYKREREVGLRWTRLGDSPRVQSLQVHVVQGTGAAPKIVKVDNPEGAESARISDLTPGATYTFTLVAVTARGTMTGLPFRLTV